MATQKVKQADALFLDLPFKTWRTVDDTWANWSGLWTIRETLASAIILTGSLTRSVTPGVFSLRIGPATTSGWSTLPVGDYVLTYEINNFSSDFRKETQDKLVIAAQGVPNV